MVLNYYTIRIFTNNKNSRVLSTEQGRRELYKYTKFKGIDRNHFTNPYVILSSMWFLTYSSFVLGNEFVIGYGVLFGTLSYYLCYLQFNNIPKIFDH